MKKYDNFCKALANLKEGVRTEEPYSVVVQVGIIGLMEICFEQSWKLMKALLEEHGRMTDKIGSPRGIIKVAYQCGMITDSDGWLDLLEARNILSHTYDDEYALQAIGELKSRYILLFEQLKEAVDRDWLL